MKKKIKRISFIKHHERKGRIISEEEAFENLRIAILYGGDLEKNDFAKIRIEMYIRNQERLENAYEKSIGKN